MRRRVVGEVDDGCGSKGGARGDVVDDRGDIVDDRGDVVDGRGNVVCEPCIRVRE